MEFASPEFWFAVLQIIAIDILLGGDNAVVIALACRRLPEKQRNQGIFWGVVGAIGLRVVLIFFALQLLEVPYLKLIGAALLLWIGVKLLLPEKGDAHGGVESATTLAGAIKTIIVADGVMSLDNVIAVAGAAKGDLTLVVFGILVSIPIVVWGSKLVLRLMGRYPVVITLGGALLGWIAGGMIVTDVAVKPFLDGAPGWLGHAASAAGALVVWVVGMLLARRVGVAPPTHVTDLVHQDHAPVAPAPDADVSARTGHPAERRESAGGTAGASAARSDPAPAGARASAAGSQGETK